MLEMVFLHNSNESTLRFFRVETYKNNQIGNQIFKWIFFAKSSFAIVEEMDSS